MGNSHINRVLTDIFDTNTGTNSTEIKLEIPVELIQNGFVTAIGGSKHLAVLLAILAHSDAKGESYPTQERIAKLVGMTRQTVSKIIADLLEVKIDGKYLISREKTKAGQFKNSVYTYMAPETKITTERRFKNSTDVIKYFCDVYYETYGTPYMPMWGRDGKLVKDKLLSNYNDDQIKGMIDVAVGEYKNKWYKPQFPRPNINILCGWLGNTALEIYEAGIKEQKELEERMNRDIEAELNVASKYI